MRNITQLASRKTHFTTYSLGYSILCSLHCSTQQDFSVGEARRNNRLHLMKSYLKFMSSNISSIINYRDGHKTKRLCKRKLRFVSTTFCAVRFNLVPSTKPRHLVRNNYHSSALWFQYLNSIFSLNDLKTLWLTYLSVFRLN